MNGSDNTQQARRYAHPAYQARLLRHMMTSTYDAEFEQKKWKAVREWEQACDLKMHRPRPADDWKVGPIVSQLGWYP